MQHSPGNRNGVGVRVGILTFHRALNYGAVLQAYALQTVTERLGADCDIIDYRCETLESSYRLLPINSLGIRGVASALVNAPVRGMRKVRFADFRRRHIIRSREIYSRNTIAAAAELYDYLVVGSDQVWNPDVTGGDETFFLDFCEDATKKVSYAASLGKGSTMPLHQDTYVRSLSDFHAISVRESDASEYLSGILEREVLQTLDPVLLLSKVDWERITTSSDARRPYIFAFCLHETEMYRYVEHLRAVTDLDVVYIPESIRTRIRGTRRMSPAVGRLLSYIRNAEYVVTDSFHVTAFAIIFERAFKVQLKRGLPELNPRMTSLLDLAGLSSRIITDDDLELGACPPVDYAHVAARLSPARESSLAYLSDALGLGPGS